ncbi:GPI-anchored surface protein, putative [Bodo saltans]|uniref:GPI-anchored surface protein, putative n=1 Tax=Bodo saltans TaxID=75058 RepID=A0A0S4JIB9_BODSA|nr:GPI-anchored surface protein, putative [Bodo saltans]|eukprot:CUG88753.1 GPI-anchored surface protein, putative [Bodo saltans]
MHAVMQVSCLDHRQQKRHRLQLTLNLKSLSCASVGHTNPLLILTTLPQLTDVKHFSKISLNVKELSLLGFFLNSKLLEAIAQIRGLEVVDLADSYLKVTDHLHLLFCLKRLRTLRLPRCSDNQIVVGHQSSSLIITDFVHGIGFSMSNYRWLTHLTRLCVHEAHITSTAFVSLPMLKQLLLQDCVWNEVRQTVIPYLPLGLEVLDVRSTDPFQFFLFTKSASFRQIGLLLTELRDLSLVQNYIMDAGLRHLAGLRLRRLELSANMLKPGDEKILVTFTELRTLRVNSATKDGVNKKISRIVSSATQLHTLIVDSFVISDSFFDHIAMLSELRALQLLSAATGVNDANLAKLAWLRCLVSVNVKPFQMIGSVTNTNDAAVGLYSNDVVKYLHTAGICLSPRGQQVDGLMGLALRALGVRGMFWSMLSHTKHCDRYASRSLWLLDVVRACVVNVVFFLWQLVLVLSVVITVCEYFGGLKWWLTLFD